MPFIYDNGTGVPGTSDILNDVGDGPNQLNDNGEGLIPTCWSYRARYKNSYKLFSLGGHEKFPSKLKVPGNVDRSSGIMTDEGKFIDPGLYTVE